MRNKRKDKFLKSLKIVIVPLFILMPLCITGCSAVNTVGDAVSQSAVAGAENEKQKDSQKDITQEEKSSEETSMKLNEIDWTTYEKKLSEDEYQVLQKYISVLTGKAGFLWDYSFFTGKKGKVYKKVTLQQFLDAQCDENPDGFRETLILNSLAFCDVFQSGSKDLVLHLENHGWEYLILHYDNGKIYGVDQPERCFEMLQANGLYYGSGGASTGYYRRMSFTKGKCSASLVALRDEKTFYIGSKIVSEKKFQKWKKENFSDEVKWYAPA